MPRTVRITIPPDGTDALLRDLQAFPGLIGLRVQRGVSLTPPGDLVSLDVTTRDLHRLMGLLDRRGIGMGPASSAVTSHPLGMVTSTHAAALAADQSDATWEEMELTIGKESNMTANGLLLMALAGVIAAAGISTGSLHLVVGAMVIAPGFEPISRIALGMVAGGRGWRRGLADTAKGYLALAAAAALTGLLLRSTDTPPLGGGSYLPADALVAFWTGLSVPGLLVTLAAGTAGGVLLAANRSVLTAGVMIALSLVPSAVIASMALVEGETGLAARALLRWGIEVAAVLACSALVFLWKRAVLQRRSARG